MRSTLFLFFLYIFSRRGASLSFLPSFLPCLLDGWTDEFERGWRTFISFSRERRDGVPKLGYFLLSPLRVVKREREREIDTQGSIGRNADYFLVRYVQVRTVICTWRLDHRSRMGLQSWQVRGM